MHIEIFELDIIGESLGKEKCFGAVKGMGWYVST